ncbi:MAG: PQQ-binding-like beta-propeller repeat protein, partial [Thermoanaerobaculia bacterium]
VYSLGALGHLFALDEKTGGTVFAVDLVKQHDARLPTWGSSASPLIHGDLLVVVAGARPGGTVMALDRRTGKERWRALDERPGYSSPVSARIGGREEIVVWTADAASGLDPASGCVLWRAPFRTSEYDVAIISPFVEGGQLFVSGYWDGAESYKLGGSAAPALAWKHPKTSCLMADPLFRDGRLYALDKDSGLLCLDWASGKVLWNDAHAMTPKGRNPHASLVWAGEGRAAVLNSEGHLILARLSPEGYAEEGRVPIIGFTWAHPAFAGQEVLARSDTEMVCVGVKPGG